MTIRPLVGVTTNCEMLPNGQFIYKEYARYLHAIEHKMHASTVMIPALGENLHKETYIKKLDAIVFTGSASNVHPSYYYQENPQGNIIDRQRDKTNFSLIYHALESHLPLFFICRGIQELNVALGGTLHQKITYIKGKHNHYRDLNLPYDLSFQASHSIYIQPNGILDNILSLKEHKVNSIHHQAIEYLGQDLLVEAVSDDDIIEAISLPYRSCFTLGVQWHPEHSFVYDDTINHCLWQLFRNAI